VQFIREMTIRLVEERRLECLVITLRAHLMPQPLITPIVPVEKPPQMRKTIQTNQSNR